MSVAKQRQQLAEFAEWLSGQNLPLDEIDARSALGETCCVPGVRLGTCTFSRSRGSEAPLGSLDAYLPENRFYWKRGRSPRSCQRSCRTGWEVFVVCSYAPEDRPNLFFGETA